jgi:hypothetical protein
MRKVLDGKEVEAAAVAVWAPAEVLTRAEALRRYVRRQKHDAPTGVATRATVLRVALRIGLAELERKRYRAERNGETF